jgi:hypothetical protein
VQNEPLLLQRKELTMRAIELLLAGAGVGLVITLFVLLTRSMVSDLRAGLSRLGLALLLLGISGVLASWIGLVEPLGWLPWLPWLSSALGMTMVVVSITAAAALDRMSATMRGE